MPEGVALVGNTQEQMREGGFGESVAGREAAGVQIAMEVNAGRVDAATLLEAFRNTE